MSNSNHKSKPIEDEDTAALVASILEDSSVRLRMLLGPSDTARAFVEAGTFGMLRHCDYEALIETVAQSARCYISAIEKPSPYMVQ